MDFMADVINEIPNISVITQIEALPWMSIEKSKEEIIKSFIVDSLIFTITPAVVLQCEKLRRGKKLKTPDAIIAATAIVHKFTLITSDADFSNIPGLKIIDPKSL